MKSALGKLWMPIGILKNIAKRGDFMNKITVIGSGSVGSTIEYTLTIAGLASEIVMIDINGEKALGEALDIRQGTPFCNPCTIYAGNYSYAKGSDIVVITSGVARKAGQSRLDLAQVNVNILKSITPEIIPYAPDATYVIAVSYTQLDVYKRQVEHLTLNQGVPGSSP